RAGRATRAAERSALPVPVVLSGVNAPLGVPRTSGINSRSLTSWRAPPRARAERRGPSVRSAPELTSEALATGPEQHREQADPDRAEQRHAEHPAREARVRSTADRVPARSVGGQRVDAVEAVVFVEVARAQVLVPRRAG